jgi:hypothetical protein
VEKVQKMDNTISKNNDLMFNGTLNGDIAAAGELTLDQAPTFMEKLELDPSNFLAKFGGTSSSAILVKSSQVPS